MSSKGNKLPGVWKLTSDKGPFVKSHLLPSALIRLSRAGRAHRSGDRQAAVPARPQLVRNTLDYPCGRGHLEVIDASGSEALRHHKLNW
jgi:hypothetical protein